MHALLKVDNTDPLKKNTFKLIILILLSLLDTYDLKINFKEEIFNLINIMLKKEKKGSIIRLCYDFYKSEILDTFFSNIDNIIILQIISVLERNGQYFASRKITNIQTFYESKVKKYINIAKEEDGPKHEEKKFMILSHLALLSESQLFRSAVSNPNFANWGYSLLFERKK